MAETEGTTLARNLLELEGCCSVLIRSELTLAPWSTFAYEGPRPARNRSKVGGLTTTFWGWPNACSQINAAPVRQSHRRMNQLRVCSADLCIEQAVQVSAAGFLRRLPLSRHPVLIARASSDDRHSRFMKPESFQQFREHFSRNTM